jgi:hypothetical protein
LEREAAPQVDSAVLAGTALGDRLRQVFAADYRAYPLY